MARRDRPWRDNSALKGITRDALRAAGLTQSAFAERRGISQAYLSEVINGHRHFPNLLALQLEEATGVDGLAQRLMVVQALDDLDRAREKRAQQAQETQQGAAS